MGKIDYHIPDGCYIAMDKNGRWRAYATKPMIDKSVSEDMFVSTGESVDLREMCGDNWKKTVIKIGGRK